MAVISAVTKLISHIILSALFFGGDGFVDGERWVRRGGSRGVQGQGQLR